MMKHFKINVGRKKLSSGYIQSKQNFDSVLKGVKLSQSGIWRPSWFYGVIGVTSIAALIGYRFYKSENHIHEVIITQNNQLKKEIAIQENFINEFSFVNNAEESHVMKSAAFGEENEPKRMEQKRSAPKKAAKEQQAASEKKTEDLLFDADVVPQVHHSDRQKTIVRSSMPSISGVYNGDISWESFKEGEIFVGEDFSVKQFSIQYTTRIGDKTISVKGNKIPSEVVSELENLGLDQTIFITNVVAGDQEGELMRFVSMDLNLKFK